MIGWMDSAWQGLQMVSFIDKCNHFVMLCFHDLTIVIVNTVQQWCRDCVDDALECCGIVPFEIGLDFLPVVTA